VNLAGYKQVAASGSSVVAAGAIFGNAGDGSWSHTCVGINLFFYFILKFKNISLIIKN
jgi:hypothetical protein